MRVKTKTLKVLAVLFLCSFFCLEAAGTFPYGAKIPWTKYKRARIDTRKEDKVALMKLLSEASGKSGSYGKASSLFDTLANLISKNDTVSKSNFMFNSIAFSSKAEEQSKTISKEAYEFMSKHGLIENADKWRRTFSYNCNRLNPWSVKKAIKLSVDWINCKG